MVCFQEEDEQIAHIFELPAESTENERVSQLETELARTKEHLQTVIEELETSNEELQSLNEELQSSNEELQSSNEELETTNEELQSTNEELQTAYAELRNAYEDKEEQSRALDEAQAKLLASNESLERAQRVGQIGSYEWDLVNHTLHWSREMYRVCGKNPDHYRPVVEDIIASVHPDDRERYDAQTQEAMRSGLFDLRYRIVTEPETVKFVHARGEVSYSESKAPIRMIGTMQDVTQLSLANQQLEANETQMTETQDAIELFSTHFAKVTSGLALADMAGNIKVVNPAFARALSYDVDAMLTRHFNEITYVDDLDKDRELHEKIINGTHKVLNATKRYLARDGSIVTADIVVTGIRDADANTQFVMVIATFKEQEHG